VIFSEHSSKPLLAESLLALFGRNVVVVDRADSRRGWALVQVLHELVQSALLALSLASDLWVKRINLCPQVVNQEGHWLAYAAIALVLYMAGEPQALGLFGREGAEADALDFAGDFELDLVEMMLVLVMGEPCSEVTHSLGHFDAVCWEWAHVKAWKTMGLHCKWCGWEDMSETGHVALESDRHILPDITDPSSDIPGCWYYLVYVAVWQVLLDELGLSSVGQDDRMTLQFNKHS
jgi:hypothetical protein